MDDQQRALSRAALGVLAQTLSGVGMPVEFGGVLRVGGAGGPVISETDHAVDFARLWAGKDDAVCALASASPLAVVVAYAGDSRAHAAWALDIASEFAVLMLSTTPPDGTVLHVAVPQVLTGRMPHVASSQGAARAFFHAGKLSLSPFRWNGSALEFDAGREQWAVDAVRVLSPRFGGVSGVCGCCLGNEAAAYVSNYSDRG
jgi:hypothetical protein